MTATIAADVTDTSIDQANTLLTHLIGEANPEWEALMDEAGLTDPERTAARENLEEAMASLRERHPRIHMPVGAYLGSTGVARTVLDVSGEEAQRAVRLLKEAHRLIQCGRGRGKMLIVVARPGVTAAELLGEAETVAAAATTAQVTENAEHDVIESVRNYVTTMEAKVAELTAEVEGLQAQLEARDETIAAATTQLRELEDRATHTW